MDLAARELRRFPDLDASSCLPGLPRRIRHLVTYIAPLILLPSLL
jgi:hypothetical protein